MFNLKIKWYMPITAMFPTTTATALPAIITWPKAKKVVQKWFYDNIDPIGYNDIRDRIKYALTKDTNEGYSYGRDQIWADYLNIPEEERHDLPSMNITTSNYKPTIGGENRVYKKIDLNDKEKLNVIYDALGNVPMGTNKVRTYNNNTLVNYFGPHTIGRGFDPERGEYISYYDAWDLEPWKGESASGEYPLWQKAKNLLGSEDASLGIGTPQYFYDRIYLDEFFDVPKASVEEPGGSYGGYIRPAYLEVSRFTGTPLTGDDYTEGNRDGLPTYKNGSKLWK